MDFENQNVQNHHFSTKSVPDLCFSNSAVCWGPKNRTNRGIPVLWLQHSSENEQKGGTLKIKKSKIVILVLNQS